MAVSTAASAMAAASAHVAPGTPVTNAKCHATTDVGATDVLSGVHVSMASMTRATTRRAFASANQAGVAITAICPVCQAFSASDARPSALAQNRAHAII